MRRSPSFFRRGPSKRVRLILWRTDTDTFEPGHWIHQALDGSKANLSPDGRFLVYSATNYRRSRRDEAVGYNYVAVSRPPYLTALGLWTTADNRYNGYFHDNSTLYLDWARAPHPKHRPPRWLDVRQMPEGWNRRTVKGWKSVGKWIWDKPLGIAKTSVRHRLNRCFSRVDWDADAETVLDAEFADVDQNGRLVATRGGQLFVVDPRTGDETLLADFADMTPEPIAPPAWATTWEEVPHE